MNARVEPDGVAEARASTEITLDNECDVHPVLNEAAQNLCIDGSCAQ
ncbi:hypothetical protein [Bradyrhizobium sp. USDA 4454]